MSRAAATVRSNAAQNHGESLISPALGEVVQVQVTDTDRVEARPFSGRASAATYFLEGVGGRYFGSPSRAESTSRMRRRVEASSRKRADPLDDSFQCHHLVDASPAKPSNGSRQLVIIG